MPYYPPFPNVPDVAARTKDTRAANTKFVQESSEQSGWRLVQVNVTTGSENQLDFIPPNFTSVDVDAIKYRISNISGGSGSNGIVGLVRVNDLVNNKAINNWGNTCYFTTTESSSIAFSAFTQVWSQGPQFYNSSTGLIRGTVEGTLQTMGNGRLVGRSNEQRLAFGSAGTGEVFQDVNWSMWSAPNIYPTNRIEGVRVLNWGLSSGGLNTAVNYNAGIKFEWFIKAVNS